MFFSYFVGFVGAFFILLAFWLLTHRVVHSHSYEYLGLNLFGGACLAFETYSARSYASFILNVFWFVIALYGLLYAHKRKPAKLKR